MTPADFVHWVMAIGFSACVLGVAGLIVSFVAREAWRFWRD